MVGSGSKLSLTGTVSLTIGNSISGSSTGKLILSALRLGSIVMLFSELLPTPTPKLNGSFSTSSPTAKPVRALESLSQTKYNITAGKTKAKATAITTTANSFFLQYILNKKEYSVIYKDIYLSTINHCYRPVFLVEKSVVRKYLN